MEIRKIKINSAHRRFVFGGVVLIIVMGLYTAIRPANKSKSSISAGDFFSGIIGNLTEQTADTKILKKELNPDSHSEDDTESPDYIHALTPTQTLYIRGYANKTIQVPAGEFKKITIFNVMGTEIKSGLQNLNQPEISIPGQGIFFLTITFKDGLTYTEKLVNFY